MKYKYNGINTIKITCKGEQKRVASGEVIELDENEQYQLSPSFVLVEEEAVKKTLKKITKGEE